SGPRSSPPRVASIWSDSADDGTPLAPTPRNGRTTMTTPRRNVGTIERWVSTIAGGALALHGLRRGSIIGAGLSSLGAAIAYRGLTGHCPLYETLGINTASPPPGDPL